MTALERFLKYITFDTQSEEGSLTFPSTQKQLLLAHELLQELQAMNLESFMDEYGQVYAFLDGEPNQDRIGFNAHIDTASELSGANVHPQIITNYDGEDIALGDNYVLSPHDFPRLKNFIGSDLITTDGSTLLGGDDKAGIAIIMSLLDYLVHNPHLKHHPLSILFSMDEEIGEGATHFDNQIFKADYAFTIDGSEPDVIAKENFNAAHAKITINGLSIHPGEAKNKMINASSLAVEFINLLPAGEIPERTENKEGFHHLSSFEGTVDKATLAFIIRNHDMKILERQVKDFYQAADIINQKYGKELVHCEVGYDYKNMAAIFKKDNRAIKKMDDTFKKLGWTMRYEAIRGGTDGATFSYKGCPTPNLGTGSYNHHGRYEYLSVRELDMMVDLLKTIVII